MQNVHMTRSMSNLTIEKRISFFTEFLNILLLIPGPLLISPLTLSQRSMDTPYMTRPNCCKKESRLYSNLKHTSTKLLLICCYCLSCLFDHQYHFKGSSNITHDINSPNLFPGSLFIIVSFLSSFPNCN